MLTIHPSDNVAVETQNTPDVPAGHKRALRDIQKGEAVIKYGYPIGRASAMIPAGAHVHTHNLVSALSGTGDYVYKPKTISEPQTSLAPDSFLGYRTPMGAGTRSELWILPMVGCVNALCRMLAVRGQELLGDGVEGVYAFEHPFGCSQLGGDLDSTRRLLAGLAHNANAAGILIVALGCENNTLDDFRPLVQDVPHIRFLTAQDAENEEEDGLSLLAELAEEVRGRRRELIPVSELCIGLKCGGSDGFSGLTADPLLGRFTDRLVGMGGSAMLTEVSEMFGAEPLLLNRCVSRSVFEDAAVMLTEFREMLIASGEAVYDNPSPGNHDGGITTLEEKSLGCTTKAGSSPVSAVVRYGNQMKTKGLALLESPSNDIVATTALAAAGAVAVLFTTGRGTPLGGPVPVVKVGTNAKIAAHKRRWIDFDASGVLEVGLDGMEDAFRHCVLDICSGRRTRSEENQAHDIAIWRRGPTM